MLKFKVDENVPAEASELFRQAGYDARSIRDQQLVGHPDIVHLQQEELAGKLWIVSEQTIRIRG